MRRVVGEEMGVKAAGGVRDLEGLKAMVAAGATRVGASAGVRIVQESQGKQPTAAEQGILGEAGRRAGLSDPRRTTWQISVRNSYAGWHGLARWRGSSSFARKRRQFDREFPELFGRGRRGETGNGEAAAPRRRRAMSAAARKAVSERMRKYWAERRKSKAAK